MNIGERVGLVGKGVEGPKFIGFGFYLGDAKPPCKELCGTDKDHPEIPFFETENGETVWSCEIKPVNSDQAEFLMGVTPLERISLKDYRREREVDRRTLYIDFDTLKGVCQHCIGNSKCAINRSECSIGECPLPFRGKVFGDE